MESTWRFIQASRELEQISLEFIEDVRGVWGDDADVSKILNQTREALGSIQATLDVLEKAIKRVDELRIIDRRKHLRVVKGKG